jgi:hypothetical protein
MMFIGLCFPRRPECASEVGRHIGRTTYLLPRRLPRTAHPDAYAQLTGLVAAPPSTARRGGGRRRQLGPQTWKHRANQAADLVSILESPYRRLQRVHRSSLHDAPGSRLTRALGLWQ